jgi:hypothetical protein
MNKSLPGIKVAMTGHTAGRFINLPALLLVYLVLVHTAPSFAQDTVKGLHIVELKSKAGLVKVFLPDDIAAGDTVSASIALYPGGSLVRIMMATSGY